ncbi:MAG: SurA N-terminal domain-containing protein [Nitrospirota bacterium]|nr:SurA N-terminal domain-containing protein [Nitrospirota bacterium]
MNFRILYFIAVVICISCSAGCSRPVAEVNGEKIDKAVLDLHFREKVQELAQQNISIDKAKLKKAVLQELIGEKLILKEAAARGIRVSAEEVTKEIDAIRKSVGDKQFNKALREKKLSLDAFKDRTREKMTMKAFIESLVGEDAVSEEEIRDFYGNSRKTFIKPSRVFMSMIEFDTEDAARAVADNMKKNKIEFDDMAKKISNERKTAVMEYGWVSPDFFSPLLANAINNIEDGAYGGPYKGQKGYYLIKVKERQRESIAKYEEVKDDIRKALVSQKRQAAVAHWIAQKKKASKIEVFPK